MADTYRLSVVFLLGTLLLARLSMLDILQSLLEVLLLALCLWIVRVARTLKCSVYVPWLMSFSSFFAGSDDPNNPIVDDGM